MKNYMLVSNEICSKRRKKHINMLSGQPGMELRVRNKVSKMCVLAPEFKSVIFVLPDGDKRKAIPNPTISGVDYTTLLPGQI